MSDDIATSCPSCGEEYDLPRSFEGSLRGKAVRCDECREPFVPFPGGGLLGRRPQESPIELSPYRRNFGLLSDPLGSPPTSSPAPSEPASSGPGDWRTKTQVGAPPQPAHTVPDAPAPSRGLPPPPSPSSSPAIPLPMPSGGGVDLRSQVSAVGGSAAAAAAEEVGGTVRDMMAIGFDRTARNPLSKLDVRFTGIEAPYEGKSLRVVKSPTIIGRVVGDLQIPDGRVSGKHCQLDVLGIDQYSLKDLASTNGTLVNDRPISTTLLKNGDVVSFGGIRFRFDARAI